MPKILNKDVAERLQQLATEEGLSTREIAERLGVSHQTVYNYRKRIAQKIPRPLHKEERQEARAAQNLSLPPDVLTSAEMEKILSAIAQDGQGPTQVQAIKLLEDLKEKRRPEERRGPEPPLSSEDRIARLVRVMECASEEEVREAVKRTYG